MSANNLKYTMGLGDFICCMGVFERTAIFRPRSRHLKPIRVVIVVIP